MSRLSSNVLSTVTRAMPTSPRERADPSPSTRYLFVVATVAEQLAVQYPEHIQLLTRMGVRVEIFAADFPTYLLTTPGVTCHPVPVKRLLDPVGAARAAITIRRYARRLRPAAILYGSPSAAVVGSVSGSFTVPQRLFVVHGLREETLTGARRAVMTTARRLSARLSTDVVYVSESVRRRAEEIDGRPIRHGRVAPGGFVGTALPTTSPVARAVVGPLTVGFVGRLARDKGVPELVRAIALVRRRHPDVRLLLVGGSDPTDPLDAETVRLIEADPGIELADHVDDVRPFLRTMHIFCLPSYREGLPTVVLEAMSEMVPVVGSDATGVSEVVTWRTGWPCHAGSVESLADAIAAAADHPVEASAKAQAARAIVEERYAVGPVMAWWQQVYDDVFRPDDVTTVAPPSPDASPVAS